MNYMHLRLTKILGVVTAAGLVLGACGSGSDVPAPASPAVETTVVPDATSVAVATAAVDETLKLPEEIQGHTLDFFGKDGSNLSSTASQYQLAAADLAAISSDLGDAGPAVTALSGALGAVATCVGGLEGDFYLSTIERECSELFAAFQTRFTKAQNALSVL